MSTIFYLHAPCPLGFVLIATRDQQVCALLLADSVAELLDELALRFRQEPRQPEPALQLWLNQAIEQLEHPERRANLPLAPKGTAFQLKVWQALRAIECGATCSYQELAEQLASHPRAIARACASNPIALLIPCHRVLAKNGSLSGYRWGLARKAELLRRERGLLPQT